MKANFPLHGILLLAVLALWKSSKGCDEMVGWIIYEVLLLGCETLFILRLISVCKALTKIKKRYAFAPVEIHAGHKVQPTRSELLPALRRCRMELAA